MAGSFDARRHLAAAAHPMSYTHKVPTRRGCRSREEGEARLARPDGERRADTSSHASELWEAQATITKPLQSPSPPHRPRRICHHCRGVRKRRCRGSASCHLSAESLLSSRIDTTQPNKSQSGASHPARTTQRQFAPQDGLIGNLTIVSSPMGAADRLGCHPARADRPVV